MTYTPGPHKASPLLDKDRSFDTVISGLVAEAGFRPEVGKLTTQARAAEMVAFQAGCSLNEAMDLMTEQAAVEHLTLSDLAGAVVEWKIRFD